MKFLVLDNGCHVDTARQLGIEGNEVWYWSAWNSVYPKFLDGAPGYGVPEITKVLAWAPYVDKADVIFIPDSGMGELGAWLRVKGYTVFSAGLAERMEFDREFSNAQMAKLGIAVPKSWTVKGVDAAIELLERLHGGKEETNQMVSGKFYVKFDVWRGSQETFPAEDMEAARTRFNDVKHFFGPYSDVMAITIQASAPEGSVETGCDVFFNGREFLSPGMWGFEHGGSYIGIVTPDMTIFKPDLDRLTKYFSESGYRGAFSMEGLYDGEKLWWIDPTPRFPMPLGLMYTVFSADFGALIYGIADGSLRESNLPEGRYLGAMEICSEEAVTKWSPVAGGENTRFMRYLMDDGGKMYTAPSGIPTIGVACGQGSNLQEVEAACQKEGEGVEVYFGSMTDTFAQDIQNDFADPLAELGVDFGPAAKVECRGGKVRPAAKKSTSTPKPAPFQGLGEAHGNLSRAQRFLRRQPY